MAVKKLVGAAAVIGDEKGRVLLLKHTYGKLHWDLPGGGAEANESAAETALREVREETGLEVVVERMVDQVYYAPAEDMHHFVFVCRRVDEAADLVLQPEEISDYGYFATDDLPRPISDFTIRRIHDALGMTPG